MSGGSLPEGRDGVPGPHRNAGRTASRGRGQEAADVARRLPLSQAGPAPGPGSTCNQDYLPA